MWSSENNQSAVRRQHRSPQGTYFFSPCGARANPPYSVESSNKNEWIDSLMELYKKESDGIVKLQERNSKPLNDDYIKFIRYGQNVIDRSGNGILAYINPHGFLDGPIFRGMRSALLKDFTSIYIIDMHGNSNRRETTPEGKKDENVFDIQQGVCICLFIKNGNANCKVFHADVYGTREYKYKVLSTKSIKELNFQEVKPKAPYNYFKMVDHKLEDVYKNGYSVNELFNSGSNGIKTARVKFTLSFTKEELINRLNRFRKMNIEDARKEFDLGEDVQEWKVQWAQDDINKNAVINNAVDPKLA